MQQKIPQTAVMNNEKFCKLLMSFAESGFAFTIVNYVMVNAKPDSAKGCF